MTVTKTEEINTFPSTLTRCKYSRLCPTVSQYQAGACLALNRDLSQPDKCTAQKSINQMSVFEKTKHSYRKNKRCAMHGMGPCAGNNGRQQWIKSDQIEHSQSQIRALILLIESIIPTDKRGYLHNIFLISQRKHMLWVFIRSASARRF